MSKKYCKKASMQAVADEVKVRLGASESYTIQGSYMATEISNLEKPVNRGSPNIVLTASNPSYTAQTGKYTGGSVSVVPKNATATLTKDGNYVVPLSGEIFASVKVPAKNTFTIKSKIVTPGNGATSITVDGLSFQPKGLVAVCTHPASGMTDNYVTALCCSNSVNGYFSTKSGYYGRVTNATVTANSTSITVSNIVGTRNNASISGRFRNVEYSCMVWG